MGDFQCGEEGHDVTGNDVAGYVARVRRLADLSQRELAQRLGVGPATVGRWETGGPMGVDALLRVLRVAGLRLQVVDEGGRVVRPVAPDAVLDNAGRRFPAHLDVLPSDQRPANRGAGPRYDRPQAQGWYALRPTRDRAIAAGAERPAEHPSVRELAERRSARRAQARAKWQSQTGGRSPLE